MPSQDSSDLASTIRGLLGGLLALASLVLLLAGIPIAHLQYFGKVVTGRVTAVDERFEFIRGGRWQHVYDVKYRYRPTDSDVDLEGSHPVDASTFEHLRVGDAVPVRYSPLGFMRNVRSYGSAIDGSRVWTRFFPDSDDVGGYELLMLGVSLLLAAAAALTRNALLAWLAVVAGVTLVSGVLLMGAFAFPILFVAWTRGRRAGLGLALAVSMLLTVPLIWWRTPQPATEPAAPVASAVGTVRDMKTITAVWSTKRRSGQWLPVPFDVADIVFTPAGNASPTHFVDRVDSGSVPGLQRGGRVDVRYSTANPAVARVAAGQRTYPMRLLVYLLEMTFGFAALLALVVYPAWVAIAAVFRRLPGVRQMRAMQDQLHDIAALPEDDPRRSALVAQLRERGIAPRRPGE